MEKRESNTFFGSLLCCLLLTALVACGGGSSGGGMTGTGSATLSWTAPTTNTDGSPADVAEFRIYVGDSPSTLEWAGTVAPTETTVVINNLPASTIYFAVTAVSTQGGQSTFSNIESKTF